MEHFALFVLGLVLLAMGAPLLVFGAARLDRATGRSPFAVGIVAVAFGPCLAGLAFNLATVLREPPVTRLAVGHIIGNNIASVGLVLGVATLVRPIAATAKLFSYAIPLAIGAVFLFWFLARNNPLSRVDAGFLLAAFVAALVLLARAVMRETNELKDEFSNWIPQRMPLWLAGLLAIAGSAALVGGGFLTAAKLTGAATYLKSPSVVLGATVSAFVTSLPAVVAGALAARRGRPNLVLGIVVGSILCNTLLTAGVVAMVRPLLIDDRVILRTIPVMGLNTLLLLLALFLEKVPRGQGAILLAAYIGFMVWQWAPQ